MNSCPPEVNNNPQTPLPSWLKLDGVPGDVMVLFAHGAGADMDSDFMAAMASRLASQGVAVVRFNFPYMEQRKLDGKRRPPNRAPALLECFREAIAIVDANYRPKQLFLMGKSMGGRMAAILGAEFDVAQIAGILCLGYPFLPPKGKEVRLEPLANCQLPLLIVQGERDSFGTRAQVAAWNVPSAVKFCWIADGDHSLTPRKSSGLTEADNLIAAASACLEFMGEMNE
ncbi:alpha/beta fold hydrolase [Shewanella amazonensis]|uniref:KANL3/Tex30 alpha/beta hydrolase-like domain-containing protein n=1 Tax=Shewanella amazonensis (strain ATCC BAA-1098 / SB2B) TaxID=326297 RepID=A1S8C6_SHEAM|nr:alpha/beta fold hydrolase [Shewanella amazonensis]ABM00633.1 conserved hypothetical protein [Shewanella amazonensis SB2B]